MPDNKNVFSPYSCGVKGLSDSKAENFAQEKNSLFADGLSVFDIFGDSSFPYVVAAPSWVIPGNVVENCRYLEGRVDEVGLLFFETAASLAYTEEDLPADLAETGLSFHIHHPLDLPWHEGAGKVARVMNLLVAKAAHLNPVAHVLHPPKAGPFAGILLADLAKEFNGTSIDPENVFIENIKDNSLEDNIDVIRDCGFKVCLDLGHMQAYGQQKLLDREDLWDLVAMLHLNGPGVGGRHESLEKLDKPGVKLLDCFFEKFIKGGTVTVEVFEQNGFFKSLQYLANRHGETC
ncbi:hypothetical protein SAMN05660337_1629 [Maridesulfovibrio ferrireducens]|uniref:Sugar phosphate isomerase/epimerase n=1 Tax=Maridesulfovibrio ferrireducens TaxID=246191 RepID=A0A1G9FNZ0_9BACT|nr:cobamide remodeling phosphodiesterase CbiR [Maridesulfovibrio ferrireducens]SDK89873.1 hypothetical protein SAMN05660337_1629 [Maridesulfovibrio ferrireducens]